MYQAAQFLCSTSSYHQYDTKAVVNQSVHPSVRPTSIRDSPRNSLSCLPTAVTPSSIPITHWSSIASWRRIDKLQIKIDFKRVCLAEQLPNATISLWTNIHTVALKGQQLVRYCPTLLWQIWRLLRSQRHRSKFGSPGDQTPTISAIIIISIIIIVVSCLRPFLPGTSLEPAVIPTAQASSFTLQYFPYYVWCSKHFVVNLSSVFPVELPNFSLSFSLLFQWLQLLLA